MKHLCMSNYWLLVNKEFLQIFQHDISYKITTIRTYFDKRGLQINSSMCSHEFSWKFFLVCNSLLEISAPTQAMNFKLGRYRFGKITMGSYKQKYVLSKKEGFSYMSNLPTPSVICTLMGGSENFCDPKKLKSKCWFYDERK